MALITCKECQKEISDSAETCPHCGFSYRKEKFAKRKYKARTGGAGAIIVLIGVILLFVFPIGTVIGVFMILIGNTFGSYYMCSACKNKIDKSAKTCPHCHSTIKRFTLF